MTILNLIGAAALLAAGFIVGVFVGFVWSKVRMWNEAIAEGHGRFDPKSGDFKWGKQ